MFDQGVRGNLATFDEFLTGWKTVDSEPNMEKVRINFKFADINGDGQLSKEEFMTLLNVVGSDYIDGFMSADVNSDRSINLGEFAKLYRLVEPDVKDGMIYTAYMIGDTNNDKQLDWDEFNLLAHLKEQKWWALKGNNALSHLQYKGFKRQDGYCKKPTDGNEPDLEDWEATGIFNIGSCA